MISCPIEFLVLIGEIKKGKQKLFFSGSSLSK